MKTDVIACDDNIHNTPHGSGGGAMAGSGAVPFTPRPIVSCTHEKAVEKKVAQPDFASGDEIARLVGLARRCWSGDDGEQDWEKSAAYYRTAAQLGSDYAKYMYAKMCYEGIGGAANPEFAITLCASISWWRHSIAARLIRLDAKRRSKYAM